MLLGIKPRCCCGGINLCCDNSVGLEIGGSVTLTLNVTLANPTACPLCATYPSTYTITMNATTISGKAAYSSTPQDIFGLSTSFTLVCGSGGHAILTSNVGGYGLDSPSDEAPCPTTGFFIREGFSSNPFICRCFYEGTLSIS